MLREIGLRAAVVLLMFGVFYLLGAFVSASFNIAVWSESARGFVAIIGGGLAIAAGTFPFARFSQW